MPVWLVIIKETTVNLVSAWGASQGPGGLFWVLNLGNQCAGPGESAGPWQQPGDQCGEIRAGRGEVEQCGHSEVGKETWCGCLQL